MLTVNGRPFETYFTTPAHRMEAVEPLHISEATERFDVDTTITGGGVSGRPARCAWPSPARSLPPTQSPARPSRRPACSRDPRKKEDKKYGLVKARKAKQFTKR